MLKRRAEMMAVFVNTLFHFNSRFLSLMDVNIVDIKEEELPEIILRDDRILEYHDLHIYKPSSKYNFISFHIVVNDESLTLKECENVSDEIRESLRHRGFNHILIQVDTDKNLTNHTNCKI